MRNKNNPAIIIGGKAIALSVIRSLGKRGIPIVYLYYDVFDVAAKSKYVTQKMFVPDAENSQKEFIDTLIKNSKNFGNGVIFPCTDEVLIAVSKFKKQLEQFYTIISADWEVVQKIIEKKTPMTMLNILVFHILKHFYLKAGRTYQNMLIKYHSLVW